VVAATVHTMPRGSYKNPATFAWGLVRSVGGIPVLLVACLLLPARAAAQSGPEQDAGIEEVVVSAPNLTGVVEERESAATFGIDKPLVDTPRSVTAISDQLLDRYNIKTVYDFTAVAAGTYTGSYFGVPGSLNIRGTIADNYFNGFQQITNYATYPTPVDASSNIELVRGPPSPVYGAGQVGGYMNFVPKSALGQNANYLSAPTGAITATIGSYSQKEATVEGGLPLKLGGNDAGIYGFGEVVDSGSFYLGEHPETQVAQLTFNTDLGPAWTLAATTQYIHSEGYLKDLGWNRVTQNLIDNNQYISGTSLTPIAKPGQSFITVADFEAASAKTSAGIQQYVLPGFGAFAVPNQYTELNPATVRTVYLSPRVTDVSPDDINKASTPILYLGLTGNFDDTGRLKLESFSQYLDALNYQSSGFATLFRTTATEGRISYSDKRHFSDSFSLQSLVGISYRYTHALSDQYLNDGVNVQDRRDLSQPITPDEIFNAVFSSPGRDGYQWDDAVTSRQADVAAFLLEDVLLLRYLDVTAGVRNDNYSLKSDDAGTLVTKPGATPVWSSEKASPTTYSVSVSVRNPWVVPYYTYARSYSLNIDQGDAVEPSFVAGHDAIGVSTLREAGLKTSQLGGRLYASVDLYRQQNEYVDIYDNSIDAQRSHGFEGELRYLATRYFGVTGAVTTQHVQQLGGGAGSGPFLLITPQEAGISGIQGYGGMFESDATFLGLRNGYALHTTPEFTTSLFATYDRRGQWGLTGGVTYNSWTGGSLPGSIRLPPYALVKFGAYGMFAGARADLYVDNLMNRQYFIAEYDVDSNASVLPGVGREIHLKLSKTF
jgi:iron complex outermembrane receptor protein